MPVNVGSAVGYLDLDIGGFVSGLKTAQSEAETATNGFSAAIGKGLTDIGDSMARTGALLSATVTAPVIAAGKSIIETTASFEAGMSKVAAISGASGSELEALSEKAKYMGETTKFSATEATEAFKYMAMAGWKTEDMLEGIEGIMALSAADGLDLATTSDIVTDALTAFGLSAKDSLHFADVLAKASSSANTNVQMLGESFKYIAPVAGSLGYSVEDVALALGLMANSGIKSSQAGTSLRQALSNMINPTETAAAIMEKYGLSLYDANGQALPLMSVMDQLRNTFQNIDESGAFDEINKQLEEGTITADEWEAKMEEIMEQSDSTQLRDLSALFGVRSLPSMLSIINATEKDFGSLNKAVQNADGTAKEMSDTMMNNLNGQITILKSKLEGIAIQLGEILLPIVKDAVDELQKLADAFGNLTEDQQKMVLKVAGFAAVAGPVLTVLGKLISGFGKLFSFFGSGGAGAGFLAGLKNVGAALSTMNPWVAIIVAIIVAVSAAFADLWKHNEEFKQNMIETWETIKATYEGFIQSIKDRVPGLQEAIQNIKEFLTPLWIWFRDSLIPTFKDSWEMTATVFQDVCNVILGIVDIFIGVFTGDWDKAWEGVKSIFTNSWDLIVVSLSTAFDIIKQFTVKIFNTIAGWAKDMWNKAKEMASNFFNAIKEWFEQLPYKIGYWIGEVLGKTVLWVIDMANKAKEMAVNFYNNIKEFFETLPERIHTFLTDTLPKVALWVKDMGIKGKEAIVELWEKFKAAADELPEKLAEVGKNIVTGVWNGIKSMATKFKEDVEDFFSGIVDGVKDVLGIESPSKVFANEIGRWLPPGITNGFKQALPKAISDMKDMLSDGVGSIEVSSLGNNGLEYMSVNGTGVKRHSNVSENNFRSKGNNGGNTFIFNSPKPIDEIEAARQVNAVERRLAEGFA